MLKNASGLRRCYVRPVTVLPNARGDATIGECRCYRVSGDISGEVDFAIVAHFCYNVIIYLLQSICDFATIVQRFCYDVSSKVFGDISGEVDFATVAHFCCYEFSGEISGEVRRVR